MLSEVEKAVTRVHIKNSSVRLIKVLISGCWELQIRRKANQ